MSLKSAKISSKFMNLASYVPYSLQAASISKLPVLKLLTPSLVLQSFVATAGNTSDSTAIQGHSFTEIRTTQKQQSEVMSKQHSWGNYTYIIHVKLKHKIFHADRNRESYKSARIHSPFDVLRPSLRQSAV